ncbi:GDYXXLXY domain-containing protein [Pollutimonas harenae]|uniref:GDYXXLXY domain-containing protein n=1 Tax=Pollutimonas harenae TaxID=657015 RepID=A0A853GZQ5_9BURK|nr:GDYXXLXY domain-containing protein [Pollutimonas harenae]NYT84525.1 GDYXXLXY domain-containing protein [Pollutimonas harenae]
MHKSALGLAGLLLASAGVCWLAANWEHAGAWQKLAGIQLLLVLLVLLAWRTIDRPSPSAGRDFSAFGVLASLASVAVGGLLALVGQIYQTGADPWQLFLLWAVLLLPWLVWVCTVFIGVLFGLLLNLAAALYLDVFGGHFWFDIALDWMAASLLMALMNAVLLAMWECAGSRFDDAWRIGPRALATALAGWLVVAMIAGIDGPNSIGGLASIGLLACALIYGVYTAWRSDLAMACLAAATAYVLLAIFLVSRIDTELGLLLVIVALVVLAGVGLRQLARLIRDAARDPAVESAKDETPSLDPWYFSLLRIAVMGLAAILVIAFLFVTLELEYEQLWVIGLIVCGLGLLLLRAGGGSVLDELGTTLTVAGLLMTGVGLFDLDGLAAAYRAGGIVLMGLLVYCLATGAALRFLGALFVLTLAYILTWPDYIDAMPLDLLDRSPVQAYFPAYLRLWWLAVAAVLALAVARSASKKVFWLPLAWALVCLTQTAAWLTPAPTVLGLNEVGQQVPGLLVIWLACALLPVLSLAALMWRAAHVPRCLGVAAPLALAVASLGWLGAPGVSMALLWLVLGYALRQRALLVFAVLALLAYLSRFYYQMDASLLQKSLVLGLTGGWLLLSWLVLRAKVSGLQATRDPASSSQVPQASGPAASDHAFRLRSPWAVAGLWAGLLIVLVVANSGIYQREQILRHGQTAILALAPVDPRSLMQGDYMALRFAAEQETRLWLKQAPAQVARSIEEQRGGWLLLRPDANGEHHVEAVLPEFPDANAQAAGTGQDAAALLLEFRLRDRDIRIVTDAWFFPEGQAARYEQARYGEIRIGDRGVGLLTGLLDEQLRSLH